MFRNGLFALVIGFMGGAVLMADAATSLKTPTKVSYSSVDRTVSPVDKGEDKIFSSRGIGKRCIEKNQICRFYYRGYYYETPWWTASEIY